MRGLHLRKEAPKDHFTVEKITREAHWDGNWDIEPAIDDTHFLVHRLRQCPSYIPELHYIAEASGKPVGHIMYTASKVVANNGKEHEMLTFGPLSVLPEYQGQGVGKALMLHTFEIAKDMGHRAVLIFGHPSYYPRVGFRPAAEFNITDAEGNNFDAFMARPLYEGALDGISGRYYIDPAYDNLPEEDALNYNKKFPPKEVHKPVPISVLLERLSPPAQKALEDMKDKSLMIMTTKSEREISTREGIDAQALETIRSVTQEHGLLWGSLV